MGRPNGRSPPVNLFPFFTLDVFSKINQSPHHAMNIKIIGEYSGDTGETTLERLVDRACDGSDYGMGELEELRRTNQKQTKLIARIIEKLNLSE
jgi:hypothetical protein